MWNLISLAFLFIGEGICDPVNITINANSTAMYNCTMYGYGCDTYSDDCGTDEYCASLMGNCGECMAIDIFDMDIDIIPKRLMMDMDDTSTTDDADTSTTDFYDTSTTDDMTTTYDTSTTEDITSTYDTSTTEDITSTYDTSTTEDITSTYDTSTIEDITSTYDTSTTEDTTSTYDTSTTEDITSTYDTSTTHDITSTYDTSTTEDITSTYDTSTIEDITSTYDTSTTEDITSTYDTSTTEDITSTYDTSTTEDITSTYDTSTTDDADDTLSPTDNPTIGCPRTFPNRVFLSFSIVLPCETSLQTSLQTATDTAILATINFFVPINANTCYNIEFTILCVSTSRRRLLQNGESYQVLIELAFADNVNIQSVINDGTFASTFFDILLPILVYNNLIDLEVNPNPLSDIDVFGLCSTTINSYFIYPCVERDYIDGNKYCRDNYGTKLATISDDTATRDAAIDLVGDESVWFGLRTKDEKQWRFLRKSDQCTNQQTHYKCIDFWKFRANKNTNYRPKCVGNGEENGQACAYFNADLDVANNDISCDQKMPFLCNASE